MGASVTVPFVDDKLLTSGQVAELLQLRSITIQRLRKRGQLPCVKIGHNTVRFKLSDVQKFIESKRN